MALTWSIKIDWNNDGVLETDEADRAIGLKTQRGKPRYFSRDGLEVPIVGRASVIVDNSDRRFDPWNTGSALYPNVKPRRAAQIQVTSGGTIYSVITGSIASIRRISPTQSEIVIEDGRRWLDRLVEPDTLTNTTTGAAIDEVLESANWPSPAWYLGTAGASELGETTYISDPTYTNFPWTKSIANGLTAIEYFTAGNASAASIIDDLTAAEFGLSFVRADGEFLFLDRTALYTAASVDTITESEILKDIDAGDPANNINNVITVQATQYTEASLAVIWSNAQKPKIGVSETVTILARTGPAASITTPVASTDYVANTASDGSGSDVTADIAITLDSNSESGEISITNNGAVPAYMTTLQLRGVTLTKTTQAAAKEDAASISDYMPSAFTYAGDYIQDLAVAKSYAEAVAAWYKDPTTSPRLFVEDRPAIQYGLDLGDVVTLSLSTLGISGEYIVIYSSHSWTGGSAQKVRTEIRLAPNQFDSQVWLLGDSGSSELGGTTYLSF